MQANQQQEQTNLQSFRQLYPEYNDLNDQQLGSALRKKHQQEYSDMSFGEFMGRLQKKKASELAKQTKTQEASREESSLVGNFFKSFDTGVVTPAKNYAKGVGRGMLDIGEGLKQIGLEGAEAIGFADEGAADRYTQKAQERRDLYNQSEAGQSGFGTFGRIVGNVGPYLALPPLRGAGLAATAGYSGLLGSGIAGTQFVGEDGSRATNALIGGALGGGVPIAFAGGKAALGGLKNLGKSAYNKFTGKPSQEMVDDLMMGVSPSTLRGLDPKQSQQIANRILKNKAAAERLGLTPTPAEASGSPAAAAAQGRLGTSPEGANRLFNFQKGQQIARQKAVSDVLDTISPSSANASTQVRSAAQSALSKKEKALQQAAKPYYEKAYKQTVGKDTLQDFLNDSNIAKSYDDVTRNPLYKTELSGAPKDSIRVLDYVKRDIDDKIEAARRVGENNKVRILMKSKNKLVEEIDNVSPDYKTARGIYSEGAQPLTQLRESQLGQISKLDDKQLKRASKIIFDPSQTDSKVLTKLRDEISKENPDAWRRIIRNEMERRLDTATVQRTEKIGSAFYNKILATNRDFNQFLKATKGLPGAQKKLIDMRRAFKDLVELETTKGAAGKAKSSLDVERNTLQLAINRLNNFLGGKYDKAGINLITSGKWDKEFTKIMKKSDKLERAIALDQLLSRIAAQSAGDE